VRAKLPLLLQWDEPAQVTSHLRRCTHSALSSDHTSRLFFFTLILCTYFTADTWTLRRDGPVRSLPDRAEHPLRHAPPFTGHRRVGPGAPWKVRVCNVRQHESSALATRIRARVQLLLLAPIVVVGAWRYGSTQAVLGMAALTTALLCMRLQHIG